MNIYSSTLYKKRISISQIFLTTISAFDKSCLPELGLIYPIHFMPAAFAAITPFRESSRTTQASGFTFNNLAVSR